MVDECSGKKGCNFTTTKSGMGEPTCAFLHKSKAKGMPIKIIQLDPADKNHKLKKRAGSVDWKELQPMEFEFIS